MDATHSNPNRTPAALAADAIVDRAVCAITDAMKRDPRDIDKALRAHLTGEPKLDAEIAGRIRIAASLLRTGC